MKFLRTGVRVRASVHRVPYFGSSPETPPYIGSHIFGSHVPIRHAHKNLLGPIPGCGTATPSHCGTKKKPPYLGVLGTGVGGRLSKDHKIGACGLGGVGQTLGGEGFVRLRVYHECRLYGVLECVDRHLIHLLYGVL